MNIFEHGVKDAYTKWNKKVDKPSLFARICLMRDPQVFMYMHPVDQRDLASFALRLGVFPGLTHYCGERHSTEMGRGIMICKAVMKACRIPDLRRIIFRYVSDDDMAGYNILRMRVQQPLVWKHMDKLCADSRIYVTMEGSMPYY